MVKAKEGQNELCNTLPSTFVKTVQTRLHTQGAHGNGQQRAPVGSGTRGLGLGWTETYSSLHTPFVPSELCTTC